MKSLIFIASLFLSSLAWAHGASPLEKMNSALQVAFEEMELSFSDEDSKNLSKIEIEKLLDKSGHMSIQINAMIQDGKTSKSVSYECKEVKHDTFTCKEL